LTAVVVPDSGLQSLDGRDVDLTNYAGRGQETRREAGNNEIHEVVVCGSKKR
jgi:hypothetical protein